MTRKCKTCGRTVGQYAYGGGDNWRRTHYEQRVGKTSKDRWLQATSQFGSEYREDEKKVVWDFPNNPNSHALFCRAVCMETYMEQMNETIARLPNLISV